MAVMLPACGDDEPSWPDVDGKAPQIELESLLVDVRAGSPFTIKGKLSDADGLRYVTLKCPGLYLDKTIDLPAIYGEPLTEYDLEYTVTVNPKEVGDRFEVSVTATDVAGRSSDETLTVNVSVQ